VRATVVNAFSVDVEDWYQVSDFDAVVPRDAWASQESRVARSTDRILALLDDAGMRGTFFVLGWNAERHPEVVRRIAAGGHELASHGYGHQVVYELTPDAFRADVMRAKRVVEDLIGAPVLGYRAPSLSITRRSVWALDVLAEAGFRYDSSIMPVGDAVVATRFPHVIRERADGTLVEFPISTARVLGRNLPLGGGGWLRVFPYAYFRWGLRRVNRHDGQPAVVYIHPWEVDPDHPRLKTAGRRGFSTHYVGLARTEKKLRRLLHDFRFASLREVLGLAA
jgi:polysaccharide deacetylase family protein (PEP-CTERM system associated)